MRRAHAALLGRAFAHAGQRLLRRHPLAVPPTESLAAGSTAAEGEFPVLAAQALIERTRTSPLIELVRLKLGFPSEVFARAVRPVVDGCAEFVQLLPVVASQRHPVPGGRFAHALELALRALDYRRAQILPRGAAPEIIGAQAHRWTYAVFVAALLYDVGHVTAGLRIALRVGGGELEPWDPLAGSLCARGAGSYCVQVVETDSLQVDRWRVLSLRLFEQFVPSSAATWLAEDVGLLRELRAWLSSDDAGPPGAIAELVLRAAGAASVAKLLRGQAGSDRPATSIGPAEPAREHAGARPADDEAEYFADAVDEALPPAPLPGRVAVEVRVASAIAESSPPSAAACGNAVIAKAPAVARRFLAWLQQGLVNGTIRVNEARALVHGVDEGMLLVSPRIFREFVQQFGQVDAEGGDGLAGDGAEALKRVQRQVLRAGWHLQADQGVNILTYQVRRGERAVSRLSGVVLTKPERFVAPVPPVNPLLVRLPAAAIGA